MSLKRHLLKCAQNIFLYQLMQWLEWLVNGDFTLKKKLYVTNHQLQLHVKYNIIVRIGLNKLELKISQVDLFLWDAYKLL